MFASSFFFFLLVEFASCYIFALHGFLLATCLNPFYSSACSFFFPALRRRSSRRRSLGCGLYHSTASGGVFGGAELYGFLGVGPGTEPSR